MPIIARNNAINLSYYGWKSHNFKFLTWYYTQMPLDVVR